MTKECKSCKYEDFSGMPCDKCQFQSKWEPKQIPFNQENPYILETTSKTEIHWSICKDLNLMYNGKNADYGDSIAKVRQKYGNTALLVRISDKFNRLESIMTKNDQKRFDEKIEDTIMDFANYLISELVERKIEGE